MQFLAKLSIFIILNFIDLSLALFLVASKFCSDFFCYEVDVFDDGFELLLRGDEMNFKELDREEHRMTALFCCLVYVAEDTLNTRMFICLDHSSYLWEEIGPQGIPLITQDQRPEAFRVEGSLDDVCCI